MKERAHPPIRTGRNLLVLVCLALAACGSNPPRPSAGGVETAAGRPLPAANPVEAVEARAEARWRHLIDGKPELAYDFLTPGAREIRGRDEYANSMRHKPVRWTDIRYVDKECDRERCNVKLQLTYRVHMPVMGVGEVENMTLLVERWLLIDGAWYHLPDAVQ